MVGKIAVYTLWCWCVLVTGILLVGVNRHIESDDQLVMLVDEVHLLSSVVRSNHDREIILLKILYLRNSITLERANTIAGAVHENCVKYKRSPDLVLAIISVESHFEPKSVSSAGAVGLMQIMPYWTEKLGIPGDLEDPHINIVYGLKLLGIYEQMYGNLEIALTAYNRGPGPVDAALIRKQNPSNGYAKSVLAKFDLLRSLSAK